eukprot:7990469-Pyramimonas_sp.AAC.1
MPPANIAAIAALQRKPLIYVPPSILPVETAEDAKIAGPVGTQRQGSRYCSPAGINRSGSTQLNCRESLDGIITSGASSPAGRERQPRCPSRRQATGQMFQSRRALWRIMMSFSVTQRSMRTVINIEGELSRPFTLFDFVSRIIGSPLHC